jgi:hypothetical protein
MVRQIAVRGVCRRMQVAGLALDLGAEVLGRAHAVILPAEGREDLPWLTTWLASKQGQ